MRISGKNITPFLDNISSAAIVVGPLAASDITLHLNFSALFLFTVYSKAAGINTSHSLNIASSFSKYSSILGYPFIPPFYSLYSYKS